MKSLLSIPGATSAPPAPLPAPAPGPRPAYEVEFVNLDIFNSLKGMTKERPSFWQNECDSNTQKI